MKQKRPSLFVTEWGKKTGSREMEVDRAIKHPSVWPIISEGCMVPA